MSASGLILNLSQYLTKNRRSVRFRGREMTGVELITIERQRQIDVEGWTPQHDDKHRYGNLAVNAAVLAAYPTDLIIRHPDYSEDELVDPWNLIARHESDRIRQLVIAGALIAAEIDRLQRGRP